MELLRYLNENKEWLFSGIGIFVISFFLGRSSSHWSLDYFENIKKTIKSAGFGNRTAENYYEDNSKKETNNHYYGSNMDIDAGCPITIVSPYTACVNGAVVAKGENLKLFINGVLRVALSNGEQAQTIYIYKGDVISFEFKKTIKYPPVYSIVTFYPSKGEV